jgi:hypothetical protein
MQYLDEEIRQYETGRFYISTGSNNFNLGSLVFGTGYWESGSVNSFTFNFSGTSFARIGSLLELDNKPNGITLGFWMKHNTGSFNGFEGAFGRGSTGSRTPWCYGNNGARELVFAQNTSGIGPDFQVSLIPIGSNTWDHYCFTFNGTAGSAFKNGSLTGFGTNVDSAVGGSLLATDTDATLASAGGTALNGALSNVVLYNRGLSIAEVGSLVSNKIPGNGLIRYWRINEGVGSYINNFITGSTNLSTPLIYGQIESVEITPGNNFSVGSIFLVESGTNIVLAKYYSGLDTKTYNVPIKYMVDNTNTIGSPYAFSKVISTNPIYIIGSGMSNDAYVENIKILYS